MNIEFGPSFFIALIFSIIGTGYFYYGKKRANFGVLGCGLGLMLFPYFVSGMIATLIVGLVLLAAPFIFFRN